MCNMKQALQKEKEGPEGVIPLLHSTRENKQHHHRVTQEAANQQADRSAQLTNHNSLRCQLQDQLLMSNAVNMLNSNNVSMFNDFMAHMYTFLMPRLLQWLIRFPMLLVRRLVIV